MLRAGHGRLVSVASVAGYRGITGAEAVRRHQGGPDQHAGGAPRRRGRARNLRDDGVPGFVRTDLTAKNAFPMPFMIDGDAAARSICNGLERGQMEIVFPLPMAVLMKIARLLPVRLWAAAMRRVGQR